uniref:Uncharacterized protein n=1 Tax=Plectus sambesii TaxID=2011161 RepID=A0A914VTC7_9BILA
MGITNPVPLLGSGWITPSLSSVTYFNWASSEPNYGVLSLDTCAYIDTSDSFKWSVGNCLLESKAVACETTCLPFPIPGTCSSKPCVNGTCKDGALPYIFTCTCNSGITGRFCDQDLNECASNPCLNKGECINQDNSYFCKCLDAFSSTNCEIKLTTCDLQTVERQRERIAMMAGQMLGSITLLVALFILIIRCIVLYDFSIARIMHMGQEISLTFAHLVILFFRSGTILDSSALCGENASGNPPKLNPFQCTIVAIFLHYIFLVHFAFLLFEALHNYTLYTYVFVLKPMMTRKFLLAICLLGPVPIIATTAVFWRDDYTTDTTCWLNGHSINFYIEILPIIAFSTIGVILSEAAGMIEYAKNRYANDEHRFTAIANATGSIFIIPISFVAWMCGFEAVFTLNLPLYSFTSIANIILALLLLIFHTFGDEKARKLLKKVFCGCCWKESKQNKQKDTVKWNEVETILDRANSKKEVNGMEKKGEMKKFEDGKTLQDTATNARKYVFDPRQGASISQKELYDNTGNGSLIAYVEEARKRIEE